MTTAARQLDVAGFATSGRTAGDRHLELVQYLPAGDAPVICAAIWREGDHVHLACPLLPVPGGVPDRQAHVRQLPQGLASIGAFEDTMTWLDAACFAATDPRDVETACEAHPEWQLRCIRFGGNDATLSGLGGLLRAANNMGSLAAPILRECLLELIQQILKNEPELVGAQVEASLHESDDVATLAFATDCAVRVKLLVNIASTDAVRQGILAHQRLAEHDKSRVQCLLVVPDLQIDRPMFLTARVAITDMHAEHVRAALVQMARLGADTLRASDRTP